MSVKDVLNQAISAVEVFLGIVLSLAQDVATQARASMRKTRVPLGAVSGSGRRASRE
jgi:hypothetical protein